VGELRADIEEGKLIDRRAEKNGASKEREALWAESVRAYHERRRRELTEAWVTYHWRQAGHLERTAASLAAYHRERAEALLDDNQREDQGCEPRGRVSYELMCWH
jgi:hypothetical protein